MSLRYQSLSNINHVFDLKFSILIASLFISYLCIPEGSFSFDNRTALEAFDFLSLISLHTFRYWTNIGAILKLVDIKKTTDWKTHLRSISRRATVRSINLNKSRHYYQRRLYIAGLPIVLWVFLVLLGFIQGRLYNIRLAERGLALQKYIPVEEEISHTLLHR